uniref:Uncharacterized protein n=1 Tax=Anguilla anguilla TaxID=7936 RepID=A0A0E9P646_ANGAN
MLIYVYMIFLNKSYLNEMLYKYLSITLQRLQSLEKEYFSPSSHGFQYQSLVSGSERIVITLKKTFD